jgi:hypothetical protein
MSAEENPYVTPQGIEDPPPQDIEALSRWLATASKLLIAVASLELFFFALSLLNQLGNLAIIYFWRREPIAFSNLGMKPSMVIPELLLGSVFMTRAAILIRAGVGTLSRKSRAWAQTAINCSLLGVFCPLLWVDVPLGLWIIYLIQQDKSKALFEDGRSARESSPKTT